MCVCAPQYRLTDINAEYDLCGTYPKLLAVPAAFTDTDLWAVVRAT